jgi:hypothetical protein
MLGGAVGCVYDVDDEQFASSKEDSSLKKNKMSDLFKLEKEGQIEEENNKNGRGNRSKKKKKKKNKVNKEDVSLEGYKKHDMKKMHKKLSRQKSDKAILLNKHNPFGELVEQQVGRW